VNVPFDVPADARLRQALRIGLPHPFNFALARDAAAEDRRHSALKAARKSVRKSLRGVQRAADELADQARMERGRQLHRELMAKREKNASEVAALNEWRRRYSDLDSARSSGWNCLDGVNWVYTGR
jgi:hypothetical protein